MNWHRVAFLMLASGLAELAKQYRMRAENEETKCQLPTCGDGHRQV
jgi:hypothetical protein